MKTAILALIAIVGLAILGGMGWLAFGHSSINQKDFEQEITPASDTPVAAAATPVTPSAAPAPAAAPLVIPQDALATPAAATVVAPVDGAVAPPADAAATPTEAAPQTGVIPVPEKPTTDTSAIPYTPNGEMSE